MNILLRISPASTYSFSSALFDIPNSDFDIIFAFRARSVWHFDSDLGDILLRDVVTPVAIISFVFGSLILVLIKATTNNLTFTSCFFPADLLL
jgi:hypothetical protein